MTECKRLRMEAKVFGRVQGVGFRYFTINTASQLGLAGFARNTPDGSVEVIAEGSESMLKSLLEAIKAGPRHAIVSEVTVRWRSGTGEFTGFSVRE